MIDNAKGYMSNLIEHDLCYDMEVGENRVRVFYGTEKREREDSRYIQEASAPAAVTVYQTCNIMYI